MNDGFVGPQVFRSGDGDVTGATGNLDRYLLEGAASGGRLALVEHILEPGVLAAPVHRHSREDEYSFVIDGTLGVIEEGAVITATRGDLVVVTIPLLAIGAVPVEPLAGKVVVDTNNYYPGRDGQVAELDDQTATSSELLQRHLPDARVVKAFNHIQAAELESDGLPAGSPGRRALAVFGDDSDAIELVQRWLDELGYDSLHGGPLAESWRIEPGTPGYGPRLDLPALRAALSDATR